MNDRLPTTDGTTQDARIDADESVTPRRKRSIRPSLARILLYGVPLLLLLAVGLPNYLRAKGTACKNACINNLRQIDGAKEQWALENKIPAGSSVSPEQLAPYLKGGWPTCPGGGSYVAGDIGAPAQCTLGRQH